MSGSRQSGSGLVRFASVFSGAALLFAAAPAWAGPATHFGVVTPANATAGVAFTFTVTALDSTNNTDTTYAGTVNFTSSDGGSSLPANSTLTNGVGTFSATFRTVGSQTITATDTVTGTINGISNSTAVSPAAAAQFSVIAPATATAGVAFNFTVTALDQFSNVATGYTGTVHFTATDPGATLPANSTLTNGTGTFSASLRTTGSQTITATDSVNPAITGTSSSIAVSPGPATHFLVTAPATATAGGALNFTVTALDQFNNTATGYTGTVHFTATDGSATLPANSTLTNGTGTFSATLKTTGSQTITATDSVNPAITGTSNSINVSPGPGTQFVVTPPATATAGVAFNFTVTAVDQFHNVVTGYAGTVHFTSSDPAAVLPANSTLTGGTGTFSATLKTAGNQTITATDTVTASITGTSVPIAASPSSATHFSVTAPATSTGGTAFNFTVTALDQFGNVATGYAGTVHFTSTDPSAILPANSTLTSGTRSFSATLRTGGSQTITATDTVSASITGTSNGIASSGPPATPAPATLALMSLGIAVLILWRRRHAVA
jgi:PEP-CTERM motif